MRILVVDDHPLVRAGLKEAVAALCSDRPDCIEAEDAAQVRGIMASGIHLDLILLDLFIPGVDGFDLISEVCADERGIPIVVLSASESVAAMSKALDCGASGYVPKSTPPELMLQALRLVLSGDVYVPSAVLRVGEAEQPNLDSAQLPPRDGRWEPPTEITGASSPIAQLTPRQREVLAFICKGRSNKMIARDLGLSEFTVKAHVAAIFRALGVSNRIEAATVARNQGFPP